MVAASASLLARWARHCTDRERVGVLFVDGVDEAQSADPAQFRKLLGVLPQRLPDGISVVFLGPAHAQLGPAIANRVPRTQVFQMPPLTDGACQQVCHKDLAADKCSPGVVRQICDKSAGHPLYLRYLVEYVNVNPHAADLSTFPTLSGPIETYYDRVWSTVSDDTAAVQLLAVLARLRSDMEFTNLSGIFDAGERAALTSTIARVRSTRGCTTRRSRNSCSTARGSTTSPSTVA